MFPVYDVWGEWNPHQTQELFSTLEDALDFACVFVPEGEKKPTIEDAKRHFDNTTKPFAVGCQRITHRYVWAGPYVPYE